MPELPDVTVYCEALDRFYSGRTIERISLKSPFLVRTFEPDLFSAEGRKVLGFRRLGKRIVWQLESELFLVLHLMIAGRLHRKRAGTSPRGKNDLLAFHFPREDGRSADTLMLTEASSKKRASIHIIERESDLKLHDPGGLEPLDCTLEQFRHGLRQENHTLKRSLTMPRLFSGIGNAYADEILHDAQLSPITLTSRLKEEEIVRLYESTQRVLQCWIDRLRQQTGDSFPEKATAFRPEMAVHGKFGEPCPQCNTKIQRIRYVENETNYCPRCQTGGKVLADRSLSRLLNEDWPRLVEDWEDN